MNSDLANAVTALNRRFMLDFPRLAAARIEELTPDQAAEALRYHTAGVIGPVVTYLAPDFAAEILVAFPKEKSAELISEILPNDATRVLSVLDAETRDQFLSSVDEAIAKELTVLLTYPQNSAGRLMEARVPHFRDTASVESTLDRLRKTRSQAARSLFVIDSNGRLSGRVSIQELALAPPEFLLKDILEPVSATVSPISSREEVVELLDKHKLVDLAVVDVDGRLLGIIYNRTLIQAIQEDATADIQTMVGASKEERALSPTLFAVKKRLPWLQINLLTAFMAASVVGIFEDTIARFTALAVLLPVVAGQSGNAGAQALAVTMRGLALREIGVRQWFRVTAKEVQTGLVNGVAVALTCGIGVYFWSGSVGLVLVIAMSMVLAMVAAGFAGALVPIGLTRIGQDPAQSSSIILTTVTDIAGFFSFLGIATLLAEII
jgi:magnesium transporter